MSADVAYFTQDYWMNSLAISHPLAFHSRANSKDCQTEEAYVSTPFFFIERRVINLFDRSCNGIQWMQVKAFLIQFKRLC